MTNHQNATFAAGCFWGIEKAFAQTPGVLRTRVGYLGGHTVNPTYEQVCVGNTQHAEAVEVIFDSEKISYDQLLALFWSIHDPTTPNRQGPDIGTQYRSAIFCHTPEQLEIAKQSKDAMAVAKKFPRDIVTQIEATPIFYEAEPYHQRYWETHPLHCHW